MKTFWIRITISFVWLIGLLTYITKKKYLKMVNNLYKWSDCDLLWVILLVKLSKAIFRLMATNLPQLLLRATRSRDPSSPSGSRTVYLWLLRFNPLGHVIEHTRWDRHRPYCIVVAGYAFPMNGHRFRDDERLTVEMIRSSTNNTKLRFHCRKIEHLALKMYLDATQIKTSQIMIGPKLSLISTINKLFEPQPWVSELLLRRSYSEFV